jgi:hypothetical protein
MWGGATPAELLLAYNEPLMDKVAIMLIDADYTAYGRPSEGGLGITNGSAATT